FLFSPCRGSSMKCSTVLLSLLLGGGMFLLAEALRSQDQPAKQAAKDAPARSAEKDKALPADADADMKEFMKKWMEFATPGVGHKKLEPLVGKWDYHQKIWLQPDSPATESSGTT